MDDYNSLEKNISFEGVTIGVSKKRDIEKTFGNRYEFISHHKYSYEMKYPGKGISFYYCYDDTSEIFF